MSATNDPLDGSNFWYEFGYIESGGGDIELICKRCRT
jgi:hypothetical protein